MRYSFLNQYREEYIQNFLKMEETGFEQTMVEEEPPTPNEHPLSCSTCGTELLPAQSATKLKKRVPFFLFLTCPHIRFILCKIMEEGMT